MIELEFKYSLPFASAKAMMSDLGLSRHLPTVKEDVYYRVPRLGEIKPRPIRIRQSNGKVFLTVKNKSYVHGGEQNEEHELQLPGDTLDTLQTMFDLAGLVVARRKTKRSWVVEYDNMTLDLCEVAPLGWFAEFETVIPPGSDTEAAWEKLTRWSHDLGFGRFPVEPRSYARLLEEYDLAMSL